jgi:protein TonB
MSYKALLFCPDEKTARAVTQVLSELDFAVERAGEPFATVKKLTDQHYDALVVDCANEQDAALLFKGARNSTFNHSALFVAVVEGQTGVAKAFRIGANLVLTKPINVEQSKGTLRVARGLLKKTEARAAAAPAGSALSPPASPILFAPKPAPEPAPVAESSPFSALELEKETVPAAEAAEAAVLESLPDPIKPAAPVAQTFAPTIKNSAEPIAASTSGHSGAAAAPALAKVPLEIKPAPPMASHDPIVSSEFTEAPEAAPIPVPSFAAYSQDFNKKEGSGKKVMTVAAVLLVVAGLGYVGIKKSQLLQNWHHAAPSEPMTSAAPAPVPAPESPAATGIESNNLPEPAPASDTEPDFSPAPSSAKPLRTAPIETIHLDSEPTQDSKIIVEPKPLVVNTKRGSSATPAGSQAAPLPPTLDSAGNTESALANLVTTNTTLPKPAPGSVRVSQGVSQGLLVKRVSPIYPPMALQLRKQGAVELLAHLSKDGSINSVQVLSGDAMLANAAVTAVRQWKYRPYLLNGLPVEIETQITVNFTLPR